MNEFSEYELNKINEAKLIYPEYIPEKRGVFKSLVGKKFNRLKVLYRTNNTMIGKKKVPKVRYVCLCDCGNFKVVIGENLKNEYVQSCGCLQKEVIIENNHKYKKKYNRYEFYDEYAIGYTAKNEPFYFDIEDYDKIKDFSWSIDPYGYVVSNMYFIDQSTSSVKFHRLILDVKKEEYVDHINHVTYDNRKCNLRITTNQENCTNRTTQYNNKTGVSGVQLINNGKNNRWMARINVNKKEKYLGYFDTFEKAVEARRNAEELYYGKFSFDNSMKLSEEYQLRDKADMELREPLKSLIADL